MFQLTACEIVTIERLFLYINTHILLFHSFFNSSCMCIFDGKAISNFLLDYGLTCTTIFGTDFNSIRNILKKCKCGKFYDFVHRNRMLVLSSV